jgi:hypothetical protein
MKPLGLFMPLLAAALLGGCAHHRTAPAPAPAAAPAMAPTAQTRPADAVPIERVPFRIGVSSATVEKMAGQQGCTGGQGASLLTEPGPVEVYRMQCDNGKVFMARCELRQCRRM